MSDYRLLLVSMYICVNSHYNILRSNLSATFCRILQLFYSQKPGHPKTSFTIFSQKSAPLGYVDSPWVVKTPFVTRNQSPYVSFDKDYWSIMQGCFLFYSSSTNGGLSELSVSDLLWYNQGCLTVTNAISYFSHSIVFT